jgi:hypothetical protein
VVGSPPELLADGPTEVVRKLHTPGLGVVPEIGVVTKAVTLPKLSTVSLSVADIDDGHTTFGKVFQ